MNFVHGMDLAENLNYFAYYVLGVDHKQIVIKGVVKKKNVMYPELEELVLKRIIPKYPPRHIYSDYTSEKAFSEFLESHLHPAFKNPQSEWYKKWRTVQPVLFTDVSKLEMKQNARQLMNDKLFTWPEKKMTAPHTWALIEETKEQLLRESGEPSRGNAPLKFPKPEGYDNDLAIAFELAMKGARGLLAHMSGTGGIPVVSSKNIGPEPTREDRFAKLTRNRLAGLNITDMSMQVSD